MNTIIAKSRRSGMSRSYMMREMYKTLFPEKFIPRDPITGRFIKHKKWKD